MKKTLTMIGLAAMFCLGLNAQVMKTADFPDTGCDLKITKAKNETADVRSGNVMIMRDKSLSARLILDHTNCKIEGKPAPQYLKDRGESWVADWPKECQEVAHHFARQLNARMKGSEMEFNEKEEPGQTHLMVVHVTELDLGNFAAGLFSLNLKTGGAIATCVIEFINKATGDVDCVIEVNNVRGLHQDTEEQRRKACVNSIIKQILKLSKN